MSGFLQGIVTGGIALLVTVQFIRPVKTNPPIVRARTVEAAIAVPPAVEEILLRSCNDCHSDLTRWPWYSYIAPVSWLVVNDVNEGRRHLNFSEWLPPEVSDPAAYTLERFHTVCKAMESRRMPLRSYILIHRGARISGEDTEVVCGWAGNGPADN
jgi:hypothetical protein